MAPDDFREIRGMWATPALETLERLIHMDKGSIENGQNLTRFFRETEEKDTLQKAAASIVNQRKPSVRILTGFYIEKAGSAETDGPLAAAQMSFFFKLAGIECCVTTDKHCKSVCKAALDSYGCSDMLEVVSDEMEGIEKRKKIWKESAVTHAIAIERPGPSFKDGQPYNMKGELISRCAPLHLLFSGGSWKTIGVIDRGNELGSGALPNCIIAEDIRHGRDIACTTGADYLLASRVSDWAAKALIAAVAILGPNGEWLNYLRTSLNREISTQALRKMVLKGAVDGITLAKDPEKPTIDSLCLETHLTMAERIVRIAENGVGGGNVLRDHAGENGNNRDPQRPSIPQKADISGITSLRH